MCQSCTPRAASAVACESGLNVAGIPTTSECAGASFVTTAFAPIALHAPIVTSPSTFAPAPTATPSSIVGCRFARARARGAFPPSVTPWYSMTSSPTSAVSPITTPMPWSMKKRRPMVAPGWISMPVSNRVNCEPSARGKPERRRTHSACVRRCAQMACRPGVERARPRGRSAPPDRAARAVAMSSRSAGEDMPSHGSSPIADVLVQHGRQVALAELGDDHDDRLAGVLGPRGDLERRPTRRRPTRCRRGCPPRRRARARSRRPGRCSTSMTSSIDLAVEDRGHEVRRRCPGSCAGRAGPPLRMGESVGLDGDDLHAGLALLEHLADAGDRAAGADARDEDVDVAVGVVPDLLGRGAAVDLRVRLVLELPARARRPGSRRRSARPSRRRPSCPRRRVGEHELGAVGAQQRAALLRHGLGHREDDPVAAGGADHARARCRCCRSWPRRSCRRAAARPTPRRRRRSRRRGGPSRSRTGL